MMLHQDASSHEWVADEIWDLVVTLDDATSEVYSGFFVEEEGTMSTFRAISEVIAAKGLFCSLYADRAAHYWHTPEAGGKVDKDNPTQVGRALAQLGIELIAAYSPEARGRSERMFGTLQKRLPQELRLPDHHRGEANRFLEEVFWPAHNVRFARPAEAAGSAFVAFAGKLLADWRTHSASRRSAWSPMTTQCAIRTGRCRSQPTATATTTSRRMCGCTNTRTPPWPCSMGRAVWPATGPTAPDRDRGPPGRVIRFDATRRRPVDKWTARHRRPDHFPTGPTTPTEAVNSYGT